MSQLMLNGEQIKDLLENKICADKVTLVGSDNLSCCCPLHSEHHPSFAISISKNLFNCFGCGSSGSISYLLYRLYPEEFQTVKQAEEYLINKYKLYTFIPKISPVYIGDEKAKINTVDIKKFDCGNIPYEIIKQVGIDKQSIQNFSLGYDEKTNMLIIPMFDISKNPIGFIGRSLYKGRRFYKVFNFAKSNYLYPMDKLSSMGNILIVVESMLDCIALHSWGYTNTVAINGCNISDKQAEILTTNCIECISLLDNDLAGRHGNNILNIKAGRKISILEPTWYPKEGKDPREWGKEATAKIINSAQKSFRKIRKYA